MHLGSSNVCTTGLRKNGRMEPHPCSEVSKYSGKALQKKKIQKKCNAIEKKDHIKGNEKIGNLKQRNGYLRNGTSDENGSDNVVQGLFQLIGSPDPNEQSVSCSQGG